MTDLVDARAEWLKWRRAGIGGSDIAVIAGLPSFDRTVGDVWAEKLGIADELEETEPMRWGQILEPVIGDAFADEVGLAIAPGDAGPYDPRRRVVDEKHPWRRCSLDGWAAPTASAPLKDASAVVEIKNTRMPPWDQVPPRYVAQVTWNTGLAGHDLGLVPVLHQGTELRIYEVPFNPRLFDVLTRVADDFWLAVVEQRHPTGALDATDELVQLARDFEKHRQTRLDAEKAEKAARGDLLRAMDGAVEVHLDGKALVTNKPSERDSLDTDGVLSELAMHTGETTDAIRARHTAATPVRTLRTTKTLKEM